MGFIFPRGNFHEEGHIAKNANITPTRKFPLLQYLYILFIDQHNITCYRNNYGIKFAIDGIVDKRRHALPLTIIGHCSEVVTV